VSADSAARRISPPQTVSTYGEHRPSAPLVPVSRRQRLLGAYYTPDEFALEVTRWALGDRPGSVLDPAFGGGAFLRAAHEVLRGLGVARPERFVCGIDINPDCIPELGRPPGWRLRAADFLGQDPSISSERFAAIVGNPPFVRHHWLKGNKRLRAHASQQLLSDRLPRTASYWAYFVLHALRFLGEDGRLGLFVPEAILQSDYSRVVREALRSRFELVRLIHIRERLFAGTTEPVVLIAAQGRGPGRIEVSAIEDASSLRGALSGTAAVPTGGRTTTPTGRIVESTVLSLLEDLQGRVTTLGELAQVRIGFVTGANHFFLRSRKELAALGIPASATKKIIGRTQWLKGLEFTAEDHATLTSLGRRTLLVQPSVAQTSIAGIRKWLSKGISERINRGHKCSTREHWFRVPLHKPPDAIATCSRLGAPLLVLNEAGFRCSNAVHAVRWTGPTDQPTARALAVGFLTSLTSTWCELNGRRYGEGVLKLEPRVLANAPVALVGGASDAFEEVSRALRDGKEKAARQIADRVVLLDGLGLSARDVRRLAEAQRDLAHQRRPFFRGPQGG
jgi:adenine-specific DNA-methyltransferase